MEYRKLGNTGMSASVIGLGAEHLDNKPYEVVEETIFAALDNEINIMDVFMPGQEIRQNIGKALKGNRDKFILQGHIGSVDLNQQYDISRDINIVKKYFENLLKYLQTDYIDIGMLFFIDSQKDFDGVFKTEFIDYALDLKKKGIIRAIGASSHNPIMAKKVIETGLVESLMFSINPAFDMVPAENDVLSYLEGGFDKNNLVQIDPKRNELYTFCQSKNVSITVMKTLGAGKLISPEYTPFKEPLTVGQCIHYALSRPAVVSTLIGCQSKKQIEEAVNYFNLTEQEKDYSYAIKNLATDFKGSCVYCNHCLPCPAQIDIAAVNKYLDIALLNKDNIPPSIKQHYNSLEHNGKDCIQCGNCERRCPFSVPIIKNMEQAAEVFG